MKIVQSCASKSWGGLEMQTLKISEALAQRNHQVSLICAPGSSLEAQARESGIDTQALFEGDKAYFADIKRLIRFFRHLNPDVIHTHLSHDLWTLVPAMSLSRSKAKFLLTKRMGSGVNKKDILHRNLYKRLDTVLAISDIIHRDVLDTCPVPPEKVFTLINGVELHRFNPDKIDGQQVRKQLGIGEHDMLIGMVGRLTPGKGQREYVRAAASLLKETKNCYFLMVGDVSHGEEAYEQELSTLINSLGLGNRLIHLPFTKDIAPLYKAMDILAFPSYDESLGNVLLEAMAMALPIVGSNSGSVPELVTDGRNGLLVAPGKSEPLVWALKNLIEDKDKRTRMGKLSRNRVVKEFSFTAYIDQLITYYTRTA